MENRDCSQARMRRKLIMKSKGMKSRNDGQSIRESLRSNISNPETVVPGKIRSSQCTNDSTVGFLLPKVPNTSATNG